MQSWFNQLTGNVRGAIFALMAAAMFTIVSALVKFAANDYHVAQILFFRQSVMLLAMLPMIVPDFPASLATKRPVLHLVRLIGALTALTLSFTAVAHLPLATAISVSFTKTIFVSVLAVIILGEVVGWRRGMAIIVGFAGMLIILRPNPGDVVSIYAFVAILAAAGAALAVVCVRSLTSTESAVTLLSYQAMFIGLLVTVPTFYVWKTPDLMGFVILVAVGVVSVAAQWLGVKSYKAGEVSVVTGMEYTKLIYATIIGVLIFSEWPDVNTFIGAVIIISASAFTIWRENKIKAKIEPK